MEVDMMFVIVFGSNDGYLQKCELVWMLTCG